MTEQIDAGAKLAGDFDSQYKPLSAAFWLKESEEGRWILYLVSDQIDDSNFDQAYGEVIRLLGRGPHMWLDPFQVKVSGVDDRTAKIVLEIQQKNASRLATRVRERMIGGLSVDEIYIYPIPMHSPK